VPGHGHDHRRGPQTKAVAAVSLKRPHTIEVRVADMTERRSFRQRTTRVAAADRANGIDVTLVEAALEVEDGVDVVRDASARWLRPHTPAPWHRPLARLTSPTH
jgi:hypothetical protein